MPLRISHMMAHREKHFYLDFHSPIGPGGVDSPPPPHFQATHAPCHADLCWCLTLWHEKSPRAERKNCTSCGWAKTLSGSHPGNVHCNRGWNQSEAERMFNRHLELLIHSFVHRVYFR